MHHLGLTRSAKRGDHMLLTPDTFIRTPLPGLTGGVAIVHTAPDAGAGFTQMTVELDAGGTLTEGPSQRFMYILDGVIALTSAGSNTVHTLHAGGFAYCPAGTEHMLSADAKARIAVIDKPFEELDRRHRKDLPESATPEPHFFVGDEKSVASVALNGDEALQVRALMPASMAYDFACNTMTYAPGASLSQVEIHYMEHGLLMLEGGGIYRLGDEWYPTEAGDFIWMGPFCPQWFCAVGKKPAKYLIYKNFNRHTLG